MTLDRPSNSIEQAEDIVGKSCGEVVDFISGNETMVHWRVHERLVANIAAALDLARGQSATAPVERPINRVEVNDADLREWFRRAALNLQNAAIKSVPQIAHPCDADHFADDAMRRIDTLTEQRVAAAVQKERSREGHNQPCYYCGERCNDLAGDPGLWSIAMSHPEEPGLVKWHHTRCIFVRLHPEVGAPSDRPASHDRAASNRDVERAEAVSRRWAEANYGQNAGPLLRLTEMIATALLAARAEPLAQVREPSEAIMIQMFKSQCHPSLCDFPDCIAKGYDRAGSATCWGNQYTRVKASLRALADKLTEEKCANIPSRHQHKR